MAILESYIITEWTGTGTDLDPNRPGVQEAYPHTVHLENLGLDDPNLPQISMFTLSGTRVRVKTSSGWQSADYIVDTEGIRSYEDTTGQASESLHPNPNMFTARFISLDTVADLIDADALYYLLSSDVVTEGGV